ncbi:MAG: hypothetical protein H6Q68_1844 [Firmicutes bacterium]|nr:hypothetical protein [Bacillota bacterium]
MNQVIKKLMIKSRQDGQQHQCDIVVLTTKDWQQVAALQQAVVEQLPEPELFFPLEIGEIQEVLSDKGITLGAVVNGSLIGFSAILFPGLEKDNIGRELGLSENELTKVGYLKVSNVQPEFRGNSLQKKLRLCIGEIAAKCRDWEYVVSTVSPKNYASIVGIFSLGLVIVNLQPKYQNYWRYTFYQNRVAPLKVDRKTAEIVSCTDIERQVSLLQQGYYGYEFLKEHRCIVFGKGT